MAQGELIDSWRERLQPTLQSETMVQLREFLRLKMHSGTAVYPPSSQWFAALNAVPFDDVKVVIIGQDPYHGAGQAHGLSFSVPPGVAVPPSLVNIFKELQLEYGINRPVSGDLRPWAQQGVLLLNAVLTVDEGNPGSHANQGWEVFTDEIIRQLNADRTNIVFILWGAYAQRKARMIDSTRHCILRAPHPSPLSAHRGFLGCGHFEKANRYLMSRSVKPIDWRL